MRRLNLRLTLALLGIAGLLAVGIFTANRLQKGRIARALLAQALAAEEQGRLTVAAKMLGRYLEFVPADLDERAHLGRLLASRDLATTPKAASRAILVLEQLLARDPDRRAERRLLVRLALDNRDRDRAAEHLKVLARSSEPDAEAEELQGRLALLRDQPQEAITWYRKAVSHGPDRVDSHLSLARLLRKHAAPGAGEEQAREADQLMDTLVARNETTWQAHLARWRYHREFSDLKEEKQREQAGKDVERARELAADETDVIIAVADLAQLRGRTADARAELDRALKLRPQEAILHRAAVAVEADAGERARAADRLRQALKTLPETAHFEFRWSLAHLLTEPEGSGAPRPAAERARDLEEADALVAPLRQSASTSATADYLQGRILAARGQWTEATRLLERARPMLEHQPRTLAQADALLARCYRETNDLVRHAAACARLAAADPKSPSALLSLASAELMVGHVARAAEKYREAIALPGTPPEARLHLARLLVQWQSQGGTGSWDEVENLLKDAEKAQPGTVEVALLRAEALAAQKRPDEAVKVLEAAISRDPGVEQPRPRLALAMLFARRGDDARANQVLDEVEKKRGQLADVRIARARLAMRRPPAEVGPLLTQLETGLEGLSNDEQSRVLTALAEARSHLGQFREAEALWARLARLPGRENDASLRLVLCELALQTGNEAGLTQALAELRRIENGEGPGWSFGEALRQMSLVRAKKSGDLAKARALLDEVAKQRAGWSAVALAKGELAELEGRPELAIADYREALQLGERDARIARRLVELLYRQQRFKEADEEVQGLLRQAPVPRGVQALAADIFLRTRDRAEAVRLATQAVPADSTDYRDQLWLGTVHAVSGQNADAAERHLRLAVQYGEKFPETWVTLIEFLAGRDRHAEAEKLLLDAEAKLPREQAPLALAQCWEALGRRDKAEEQYRKALTVREDVATVRAVAGFYLRTLRPLAAEPLLRRLSERKGLPAATEQDATWARLGLATVLASKSDLESFKEAMPLVGLAFDASGHVIEVVSADDSVERRRARARVLATRPSRTLRTKAVALLEDLDAREGMGDGDRYLLSQLYEAIDEPAKSEAQLKQLATRRSREPLYLSRYAQALLRQGKAAEAKPFVERLEEVEKARGARPGAFGSTELRARLMEVTGQGDKAVVLLQNHATRPGSRPEELLLVVQSLTRQKRFKEAAELCERAWGNCNPELLAGTHVGVLQTGRLTGEPFTRAEQAIQNALVEARKAKKPSAALLLAMAGLKGLAGRFDEEEKYYREVLEVDRRNVVALNNLAWLLSQRSGKGAEALGYIQRAIEAFGPTPDLLDTRALVHLSLGQLDQARADLQESLADTPSAARYFHLARVHQSAGDGDAAARAMTQARSLGLKRGQLHPVEQLACARLLEGIEER